MKAGGKNLKINPTRANSWQRPCFFASRSVNWIFGCLEVATTFLLFCWLVPFPSTVSLEALLVVFPRIQLAIFVARGSEARVSLVGGLSQLTAALMRCDKLSNFRSLKLGLYFCVDFLASSELIGYIDLTDYYEIWPKCSLVINAKKGVRLFWYSKYFSFWGLSCNEDRQIFNSPTSK